MHRFFFELADQITGPDAPHRTRRLVQRALAVGAMVLGITLLGPVFGYGFMAVLGVFVMLVASPEKKAR